MLNGGNCCQHKLVSCDDPEDILYTKSSGLSSHVGKVVTLSTPDDPTCRTVEKLCSLPEGEEWTAVVVDEVYEDCEECPPPCACFKLTNCVDDSIVIYTETDLTAYVGQVISVDEYPDIGWYVECSEETCTDPEEVTVDEVFSDCDDFITETVPDSGNETTECGCVAFSRPQNILIRFGTLTGCCSVYSNVSVVCAKSGACPYFGTLSGDSCGQPNVSVQVNLASTVQVFLEALISPNCRIVWQESGSIPVQSCIHRIQNLTVPYNSTISGCTCNSSDPVKAWAV